MESKKTAPAPQKAHSAEESATIRLKEAHRELLEIQADINKADAFLTPASTGTLPLEELHKVSCQLHHLLASMYSRLGAATFYCEDAVYMASLALEPSKRPYTRPTIGAVRGDKSQQ
nr:hypothetical protein [uncultured Porphyromonas sp.]